MVVASAGTAWVRRLAVLVSACALLPTVVTADCAAGSSTFTTEGCSGCNEFAVCLGYSSSDDCSGSFCETTDDCTYQCMNVSDVTPTVVMLIDFGGYKSAQEVASIKAGSYSDKDFTGYMFPDLTSEWPSASNDDVTAVGTIDLPPTATTFILSGGTADVEYPKGKVASVTLTSDFISSETQVTKVVISNLDIDDQVGALPGLLPSSVQVIDLSNTLISEFPAELSTLPSLQQIFMDNNYVTTVDTLDVIDTISMLSLENNNIHTFSGVFSNLSFLYLGGNNLTSIPTSIYSHTELKKLNLTGNPFSTREFTRDQADFLNNLETLLLSASDFSVGLECDESDQVVVHDVTVCLGDGVTTPASSGTVTTTDSDTSNASPSSSVAGSPTETLSTSGSSSASLIVGVVCGIVVVILIAILLAWYRRRQKNRGRSTKLSSTGNSPSAIDDRPEQRRNYGQLRTSTGVPMGIPMMENGVAMGIPTSPHDDEASMGIPTSVDSVSTYPMSITDLESKRKTHQFLSLWSDPELLSLQVRAEDIEDLKKIGSGAYATVWLVRYRNSQLLASKRLREERRQKKHTSTFVEEIKLLANFDHPNLVKLIGAAWTIESDLQALLEYMDGGDLRRYLSDPNTPYGWTFRKFDIAIDIIEALVYLHSFVPPLVHRDLKSMNVLLTADFKAKLSDFGTSRFRSVEMTMTAGVGTGRWLAPEVIRGDTDYGTSADIYSFGALLTELDTNQIPYSNTRGPNGKKLSDMTILHQVATGKLHPEVRTTCGPELRDLVQRCLLEDPRERPAATVIAYELRVIQKEMAASL